MVAIAVTRTDLTLVELRAAARRTSDSKQARRILAIAMVLDGYSREAAAQACGMDRQTPLHRITVSLFLAAERLAECKICTGSAVSCLALASAGGTLPVRYGTPVFSVPLHGRRIVW